MIPSPVFVGKDTGCDWLARTYDSDNAWGSNSVLIGAVSKQSSSGNVNDCVTEFIPVFVRFLPGSNDPFKKWFINYTDILAFKFMRNDVSTYDVVTFASGVL